MDTTTQGTATAADQTATSGDQATTQQTQATQATTTAATTQQAQTSPSVEELQRQLSEREEKLRLATESARHWQSAADKERQRVQALAGTQPQVDPLEAKVKALVAQNYNESDARLILGLIHSETAPLIQQNQQLQQTLQATSITNQVINTAASDKDYTPLFADPEIAMQVDQELRRCALQGQGNMVNPEYAKAFAETIWVSKNKPWLQQGQATQQTQTQQRPSLPNFQFMGPVGAQYSPPVVPVKPISPGAQAVGAEIKQHFGLK